MKFGLRLFLSGLLLVCGMTLGKWSPGAGAARRQLFVTAGRCMACHNGLTTDAGADVSIGTEWRPSMMAHSARDPYWHAAVRREILDHPTAKTDIENECSSCHMPMAQYEARTASGKLEVFAHLPAGRSNLRTDVLAADGVSCTVCHQIEDKGLGKKESFTGGFAIDTQAPAGSRKIFGPYDMDRGRRTVMQSSSGFEPVRASHIANAEHCATCHTLYTHALGAEGETVGELPEQVPYLEWNHSVYSGVMSCQSCHMPIANGAMPIASVLGQPRNRMSRHVFRAANFFMPRIFARYRDELGVGALSQELGAASQEDIAYLGSAAARLNITNARISSDKLLAEVGIESFAGHKLPTAYPSRRLWIHFTVRDDQKSIVFESGAFQPDGSIRGNDNDGDAGRYEPHYREIDDPEKVQIYEAIMVDKNGRVTTGLLTGVRYAKDNRLLPRGFDKTTAAADIAAQGEALKDDDFKDGGDHVRYSVKLSQGMNAYTIEAELRYQPIGYRWAQNLRQQEAAETGRFVSYYESMANISSTILARAGATVK